MTRDDLSMWTIYERPRDYPYGCVARRWIIGAGPEPVATTDLIRGPTVENVRSQLTACYPGLYRIMRNDGDHPSVVETWL